MRCPNCDTGTLHPIDGRWSCDGCDYSETRGSRGPLAGDGAQLRCPACNKGGCWGYECLSPDETPEPTLPGPLAGTIATILAGITVVPDEPVIMCEDCGERPSDPSLHAAWFDEVCNQCDERRMEEYAVAMEKKGQLIESTDVCPCCEQAKCVPHLTCESTSDTDVPLDIHCGEPETARCLLAHPCRFHATAHYKAWAL